MSFDKLASLTARIDGVEMDFWSVRILGERCHLVLVAALELTTFCSGSLDDVVDPSLLTLGISCLMISNSVSQCVSVFLIKMDSHNTGNPISCKECVEWCPPVSTFKLLLP